MSDHKLKELSPEDALETYLTQRANEDLSEKTLQAHRYRLQHFVRWCNKQEIDSMHLLELRDLMDYKHWRKRDGDLNNVTWHTQITTFRLFIKWAENYQSVTPDLSTHIEIPDIDSGEDAREKTFSEERATAILDYLEKYHYASAKHVLFAVMWKTGIRVGTARSLDVADFNRNEGLLEIKHRPEQDTALKNGEEGERPVALADPTVELLGDYCEKGRRKVTDEYDREPLFATEKGRASRTTLRAWVYDIARPCVVNGGSCPHGRTLEECEAKQDRDKMSQCPSSFSPHTIRRSSITTWLDRDVPKEAVGGRVNANKDTLDKHYDQTTEKSKMQRREDHFR